MASPAPIPPTAPESLGIAYVDLDNDDHFRDSLQRVIEAKTRNFAVHFSAKAAKVAFDLEASQWKELLSAQVLSQNQFALLPSNGVDIQRRWRLTVSSRDRPPTNRVGCKTAPSSVCFSQRLMDSPSNIFAPNLQHASVKVSHADDER